jgi:hypothetical protein
VIDAVSAAPSEAGDGNHGRGVVYSRMVDADVSTYHMVVRMALPEPVRILVR